VRGVRFGPGVQAAPDSNQLALHAGRATLAAIRSPTAHGYVRLSDFPYDLRARNR
jgi:hypothetical protein